VEIHPSAPTARTGPDPRLKQPKGIQLIYSRSSSKSHCISKALYKHFGFLFSSCKKNARFWVGLNQAKITWGFLGCFFFYFLQNLSPRNAKENKSAGAWLSRRVSSRPQPRRLFSRVCVSSAVVAVVNLQHAPAPNAALKRALESSARTKTGTGRFRSPKEKIPSKIAISTYSLFSRKNSPRRQR